MSQSSPEVTVLIPIHRTKGRRDWLQACINSFPKGTPYLVLENDGEVTESLNAGLRAARTEFVIPFGADDLALPGYLEMLLYPSWNADVVYPAMVIVDEHLNRLDLHAAAPFCPWRLLDMNYISGASLVRRETALKVGGWRDLSAMEDWDMWVRIHRAGGRLKPSPEARMAYRIHGKSRNAEVRDSPELRDELRRQIVGETPDVKATFYPSATQAVAYLRCQLPGRYLPAVTRPDCPMVETEEDFSFPEHRGDTAVFQIAADSSRALAIVGMKEKGIRALVEVDDNYLANPGKQIRKRQQWSEQIHNGDGNLHSVQGHKWIARHADGVIVTTEHIARSYRKLVDNVYVCPNTVDPADWPEPEKPDDGILRIAWLASLSHTDDIPLVTRAMEWASRQKNVEVHVVGIEPRWRFDYRQSPWLHDLDAYRDLFRAFDIGVAPITPTPFTLGRSDVKALEYAMGGCAPVLSDVEPYSAFVDGETCLKAKDAKGFYHAIKHLVANPGEAKQLAAAARAYTLTERTTEKQIGCWEDALNG